MQPFASLIKVTIPNYLSGLPIPDSIGGWFRLGCKYILLYPFSIPLFLKSDFLLFQTIRSKNVPP